MTRVTRRRDDGYPDSDGQPMADNTLQWDWMVKIVGEIELFAGQQVFVAGDLLWYPMKGDRQSSRRMRSSTFGQPARLPRKDKQWEEDGVAPQVVFEELSPSTLATSGQKLSWYERHGVDEYYVIDPSIRTSAYCARRDDRLLPQRYSITTSEPAARHPVRG